MTILVGVLCSDGIVIGSDSSATFGAANGQSTIEQSIKKVCKAGSDLIFAGTGSVGLSQRFKEILEAKKGEFKNKKNVEIGKIISALFIKDLNETFLKTGLFGALVGTVNSTAPFWHLIEFDVQNFQPECKTDSTWFSCMGSGQMIADPFLAFIKRVLFKNRQPTLNEGVFAAAWTLRQAIELNTGGIADPIQIATLSKNNNTPVTKILSPDTDLSEHFQNIQGIEECIEKYRSALSGTNCDLTPTTLTTPPPTPPR